MKKLDLTYGIRERAIALALIVNTLLHIEENEHTQAIELSTTPFYNGREKGICVVVKNWLHSEVSLHISFGENRSSDDIFVAHWYGAGDGDIPTVKDQQNADIASDNGLDHSYNTRKYFKFNEYGKAGLYIRDLILNEVASLIVAYPAK